MEERYCTECRAAIPKGESVCPACGVYAGDVFDGKMPRKRRSRWLWLIAVMVALVGAIWLFAPDSRQPLHTHLVHRISLHPRTQSEAMQTLRRFLTTSERGEHCVALIAKRHEDDAYIISAVDACKHIRLGDFAVDAKGNITKR